MQIPEHIQAVYDAIKSGDDGDLAKLFEQTDNKEHQVEMYHEIVAVQLTSPLFAAIVRWMATGLVAQEEVDPEEIPEAMRTIVQIVIGQLHSALDGGEGDFIARMSNEILTLAGHGGEE